MARHILHLARLYSPHKGGVETHVAALAHLELAKGDSVTVITSQNDPNVPLQEMCDGVEVIRIPFAALQSKFKTWNWIWSQKIWSRVDIVQVHDVFWWIWPVYFSVASKVFITFHGWEGQFPVRWQAKLQRWLANKLSRGVIHVGAWIQEFYWDKPDEVIYGGVDESVNKIARQAGVSDSTKITFIGRLEAANEIELYIQLFTQLKKELPRLEIEWIGDGPFRSQCEKLGVVTGMIDDPWSRGAHATLLASCSYLSMLNAQALGKVVIGLYSHKLKQRYLETYPGVKWMITGGDVTKVAAEVKDMLENPKKLIAESQAAQNFAQSQTWVGIAEHYEKIWRQDS